MITWIIKIPIVNGLSIETIMRTVLLASLGKKYAGEIERYMFPLRRTNNEFIINAI